MFRHVPLICIMTQPMKTIYTRGKGTQRETQCGKGMSEQIVEGRGQPFGFTNHYKADLSFLSREKYILTTQAGITFLMCYSYSELFYDTI